MDGTSFGAVENIGFHSGVLGGEFIKTLLAAPGDDDLATFGDETFCEGPADTGGGADDEDGVEFECGHCFRCIVLGI